MKTYKCFFTLGHRNTTFSMEFVWGCKFDTEEEFEADLEAFALRIGASYNYKEEVK